MSGKFELESFEVGTDSDHEESEDYLRGFAAGQEDAQTLQSAQLIQATQAISGQLADMAFGHAEARVQVLDRVRPLLTQVAEIIVPQVAQHSFAGHLRDVLETTFEQAASDPIRIAVHPRTAEHLADALADHAENFVIEGDPILEDGQALLRQSDTHIMIDFPALALELQTALNGLESEERIQSNA